MSLIALIVVACSAVVASIVPLVAYHRGIVTGYRMGRHEDIAKPAQTEESGEFDAIDLQEQRMEATLPARARADTEAEDDLAGMNGPVPIGDL